MNKDWINIISDDGYNINGNRVDGHVTKIADGVITLKGLQDATAGEMLNIFISGSDKKDTSNDIVKAMVLNLSTEKVEAIILGDESKVKEGALASLSKSPVQIPVSFNMLGRVVDPLGNFLDGKQNISEEKKISKKVDIKAPGIIERESVYESMQTGLKAVDSMVPVGRGQRELIIGDRQTGKTAVAVDAIINQRDKPIYPQGLSILLSDLYGNSFEKECFELVQEFLN